MLLPNRLFHNLKNKLMLIEQIENDTVVRIPNTLINSSEVQTFMTFLVQNVKPQPFIKTKNTRDTFEELFQKWQSETALLSSGTAIVSNTYYQQIILMGEVVLPFILIKLQDNPQHLFFALYQITGENPVPYAHAGNLEKMTTDWLSWGYTKGYLN
jgi:hypothetical protein